MAERCATTSASLAGLMPRASRVSFSRGTFMSTSMRATSMEGIAIASSTTSGSRWWRAIKRSIMSKSASATPSSSTMRLPSSFTPGLGSLAPAMAAKPLTGSSMAKLSSRKGRSSQSEKRFQRLGAAGPVSGMDHSPTSASELVRGSGKGQGVGPIPPPRAPGSRPTGAPTIRHRGRRAATARHGCPPR